MVDASAAVELHIPFQYKKIFSPQECTELINSFKNYDHNKDGTICLKEFKSILKDLDRSDVTEEARNALFAKYDRNEDSVIDFAEFLDMFAELKEEQQLAQSAEHKKGDAATVQGAVGTHTFLMEEVNACARLFSRDLEGDELVEERLPIKPDSDDLFHAMSDGKVMIRLPVSCMKSLWAARP